jgi:hypothetical protein
LNAGEVFLPSCSDKPNEEDEEAELLSDELSDFDFSEPDVEGLLRFFA